MRTPPSMQPQSRAPKHADMVVQEVEEEGDELILVAVMEEEADATMVVVEVDLVGVVVMVVRCLRPKMPDNAL